MTLNALQASKFSGSTSLSISLPGPEKAAALMLSLPDDQVKRIFDQLDAHEVLELSQKMATLGKVKAEVVEDLYVEFADSLGSGASLFGSFESTERLLKKFFDGDKVRSIMEEIRGPAGRTMWDKLGNVSEEVLAGYLQNEYPQTAAVVLSKIKPDHAAKVFALLPEKSAVDIMQRMLKMDVVQKDIIDTVEETLKTEFMSNLVRTSQADPFEHMAEVFNSFDRSTEGRFMASLDAGSPESAEKIRSLMFTFEDLIKLDTAGVQTVIRVADKTKLALSLKGAPEGIRELFFSNMSERAAKLMKEDIEGMGMVKLKDVEEAQLAIVTQTKDLADSGEIIISEPGEEEMIG